MNWQRCKKCDKVKPVQEYNKRTDNGRLRLTCKKCMGKTQSAYHLKNKEVRNERTRRWREVNAVKRPPEINKKYWVQWRYGISIDQFNQMVKDQNGLCKICRLPPNGTKKTLHIDHNHTTGVVRGLLCHNCNMAIGYIKDDPQLAIEISDYLKCEELIQKK